ncbi:fructose-6-phosphate aldolase [Enterococcus faecalis]|nr:fructose-6-phosphate aldolase [Enterococcus faecalis]
MEFMLDTINLEAIRKYQKILPLAGVTSNPSIVKQAGKIDFFAQMKEIKKTIGQASLHVQVVGQTTEEMLEDAQTIVQQLGQETFIKIPVNEAGLAAIKQLKQANYRITATAIYTEFQGYLAIAAGADYLAPYYNRMENLTISFKNVAQINQACQMGAQAATIAPELVTQGLAMPAIQKAVTDFQEDWVAVFGVETVNELA